MKAVSLRIKGRVQGVGFRYFVLRLANHFGVKGYVMNCPDGDVYVEAEADVFVLNQFIEQCKLGPAYSDVRNVIIRELEPKGYLDFDIEV